MTRAAAIARTMPLILSAALLAARPAAAQPGDPLAPRPEMDVDPGPSLPAAGTTPIWSPDQIRELDAQVLEKIRELQAPLPRSQAFERYGRTKLQAKELDAAHDAMFEAGQSAVRAEQGLRRDLRLMATITAILELSYQQVLEALSQTTLRLTEVTQSQPLGARLARLDMAGREWDFAFALAQQIANSNYRCEQIHNIATAESLGSMMIARAALFGGQLPREFDRRRGDLMQAADRLLVQAARKTEAIDREVWLGRSMVNIVGNAAESDQLSRGRMLAASITDPEDRTEAYVRVAEMRVREAEWLRSRYPAYLQRVAAGYVTMLETTRARIGTKLSSEANPGLTPAERADRITRATLELREKQAALRDLLDASRALESELDRIVAYIVHEQEVRRGDTTIGVDDPIRELAALRLQLEGLLPRIRQQHDRWQAQADAAASEVQRWEEQARAAAEGPLPPARDPYLDVAASIPRSDDPALVDLMAQVDLTRTLSDEAAQKALLPESTAVYNLAARSAAMVGNDDPRADVSEILINSLIEVNRFADARAALRLIRDPARQVRDLEQIAEVQGSRGFAEAAYRWIDREASPELRARLYRRVEEGVLNTIDQSRSRTLPQSMMGNEGTYGIPASDLMILPPPR